MPCLSCACVSRFECEGTVEEKISTLQAKKKELAQNVLSGTGSTFTKLSLADLRIIFGVWDERSEDAVLRRQNDSCNTRQLFLHTFKIQVIINKTAVINDTWSKRWESSFSRLYVLFIIFFGPVQKWLLEACEAVCKCFFSPVSCQFFSFLMADSLFFYCCALYCCTCVCVLMFK